MEQCKLCKDGVTSEAHATKLSERAHASHEKRIDAGIPGVSKIMLVTCSVNEEDRT